MYLPPAFFALSLAFTSFVVAYPMPGAAAAAGTLGPEVAGQSIGGDLHPLVRRAPPKSEEELRAEFHQTLHAKIALEEQRRIARNERSREYRARKKAEQAQDPARKRKKGEGQAESKGQVSSQRGGLTSHSGMGQPYTPHHPPSYTGTIPVRYDAHGLGGASGSHAAALQTPGNDPFAGLAAIDNALFGHVQGINPHSGGRPQASGSQYDAYSGTHNSGPGRSQAGMAPMYPPPSPHPPAPQAPHHASPMQVPSVPHTPLAPVPQVPLHYDARLKQPPAFFPPDPRYLSHDNSLAAALQERPRR